jgi:hypothetical protein
MTRDDHHPAPPATAVVDSISSTASCSELGFDAVRSYTLGGDADRPRWRIREK